jgi:O-antigen/teichoic acid export membrane protein
MKLEMARGADFYLQDHKDLEEVGRRALRGGIISVASGYGSGAVQIVAAVVLARLLTPHDFGLVAIITTLTSFAPFLIDFGMSDATVQRSRLTQGQASSVFWINCGIGLVIAASLAVFSKPIASFYDEPSLRFIVLCSASTFAITGTSGQHLSLLRRALQFKTIAKIQLLGVVASVAIAILLAFGGAGYWALVLRPVVNAAVVTIGAWIGCAWRPSFPAFDSEVKSMVRFGWHVVIFGIVYSISRAIDRIALGLFYSPRDVGFYQTAVTLYEYSLFSTSTLIHTVGSAALSKLQSNHAALSLKYETALSALAFFMMPAAAILSITAQDLVVIILGDKWMSTGTLLAILALRGIFLAIEGSQGWLHLSLGRADRWKNWGIITAIVQMIAVVCGLPFGVKGVAIATVAASALIAFPSISYAGRPAGIGTALVVRATGRQLIGALVCVAAGWLIETEMLQHLSSLTRISVLACFASAFYLFIVTGLLRLTEPIWIVFRLAHQQLMPRAVALIDLYLVSRLKQKRGGR